MTFRHLSFLRITKDPVLFSLLVLLRGLALPRGCAPGPPSGWGATCPVDAHVVRLWGGGGNLYHDDCHLGPQPGSGNDSIGPDSDPDLFHGPWAAPGPDPVRLEAAS